MAHNQLLNDVVMTIPIMAKDAAGDIVPLPAGIVPTISSSDPGIHVAIVGNSYSLNAMVPLVTNVSITVDDGSLTPEVLIWDVVADAAPQSVFSNILAATSVPQPVPVAVAPVPTPAPTPTPTPGP
jgi:hypothetical protein